MSGFATKLKDWGILEEKENTLPNESVTKTPIKKVTSGKSSGTPVTTIPKISAPKPLATPSTQNISTEKEQKAMAHFMELLDRENLPGPDFFEFITGLKDAQDTLGNIDESKIYLSVYKSQRSTGLTKQKIEESYSQYIKLLTGYFERFQTDNEKIITDAVGSRNDKIEAIKNDIASKEESIRAKEAEIESLKNEIITQNSEMDSIADDIHKETSNIEATQKAFESAYNKIFSWFTEVGEKCKTYLANV